MSKLEETQSTGFDSLGISPKILSILKSLNFTSPTPIQEKVIPTAMTGKDVIGIAQTGTGKTLAFAIPALHRIAETKGKVLVLLPTRELAVQVDETFRAIGRAMGLKTAILIGGQSMYRQVSDIKRNPHVVIATPGRLNDHLRQKTLKLDAVNLLILDEADRMLDMGFAPQIKEVLKFVSPERQTMLFSATMPPEIAALVNNYMKSPANIQVSPPGTNNHKISQEVFFIEPKERIPLLKKHLDEYSGKVLVFTRTKFGAKKVASAVRDFGHNSTEIHSNRTFSQRLAAMEGFKDGRYRVLVATDIVARGIDVKNIDLVINYELPDNAEDYVHRIGRTGRAESTGHAVSYAQHNQKSDIRTIERLLKKALPVAKVPLLERVTVSSTERDPEPEQRGRGFGGGRGGFGGSSRGFSGGRSANQSGYSRRSSGTDRMSNYSERRSPRDSNSSSNDTQITSSGRFGGGTVFRDFREKGKSSYGSKNKSRSGRRPSF